MNRIFKRPMFRKGGEVGGGIMTGISDRENLAEGTPSERINKALAEVGDRGIDPVAQLLIQGGLSGMSTAGKGGTIANLASAFQPATETFFKNLGAQNKFDKEVALAGVEADISSEQAAEKNRITQEIANLENERLLAEGDADRQNKLDVQIQKGKDKLAELQFKVDNPGASDFRTDQVRPALENIVTKRSEAFMQSRNPAVKANPTLTAENYTRFMREASPEIKAKFKGFKPYDYNTREPGKFIEVPFEGQPGDIVYDPVSKEFLVFDNTGGTYILNKLTFEIQE